MLKVEDDDLKFCCRCNCDSEQGGTMTKELFSAYMETVVDRRPGAIFNPKSVLLLDHARSHDAATIDNNGKRNMQSLFIPKGCTSVAQPLDVSINKPFKGHLRQSWDQWINLPTEQQLMTKSGKRQRVSHCGQTACLICLDNTL